MTDSDRFMVTSFQHGPAVLTDDDPGDPEHWFEFESVDAKVFPTQEAARAAFVQWSKDYGCETLASNARVWDMDRSLSLSISHDVSLAPR